MVRIDGELRATDWDTAMAAAATGFERTAGSATGMFSCSKATNEMNFIAQKFARTVLGTNNIDSCNRT
jgi:formate dehydrogenase major subunit